MLNAIENSRVVRKAKSIKKFAIRKEIFLLLKVIYIGLCLAGLLYQTGEIADNYFRYEVVSTIEIKLPGEDRARALTVCVDLYKSIDTKQLRDFLNHKKETIMKVNGITTTTKPPPTTTTPQPTTSTTRVQAWRPRHRSNSTWTIPKRTKRDTRDPMDEIKYLDELILGLTNMKTYQYLFVSKVIDRYFTLGHFLNFTHANSACMTDDAMIDRECIKSHFVINNDICFRWVPIHTPKMTIESDLYGGNETTLFIVDIDIYTSDTKFYAMLNRVDKLPRNEYVQSIAHKFFIPEENEVYAITYEITRQKAPYSDKCFNYGTGSRYQDQSDAISDCVNEKTVEKSKKLCAMKMFDNTSEYLHMPLQKFDKIGAFDSSTFELQHNFSLQCKSTFHNPDCHIENTFTIFVPYTEIDREKNIFDTKRLHIKHVFSQMSSYVIRSLAKFRFIDFASLILGCFGTWLGFSFLGIDPVSFVFEYDTQKKKTEKKEGKCRILSDEIFLRYVEKNRKDMLTVFTALENRLSEGERDRVDMKNFMQYIVRRQRNLEVSRVQQIDS